MPYDIIRLPTGLYMVKNKVTGEIHAKGTTLTKALKQIRLMEMADARSSIEKKKPPVKEVESPIKFV